MRQEPTGRRQLSLLKRLPIAWRKGLARPAIGRRRGVGAGISCQAVGVTFVLSTATSADERVRGARTAVLPVGSFEQHGEFLPLITDTVVACLVAGRIAEDYRMLLLPPITMSGSATDRRQPHPGGKAHRGPVHLAFPGPANRRSRKPYR
jgi:hypothetical protein